MLKFNYIKVGAVLGFLSVTLGAFGAHFLEDLFNDYQMGIYETAVEYQFYHAIAILLIAVLNKDLENKYLNNAVLAMIGGIIFFSGSLYLLAFTQVSFLGAITPIGGLFFLIGWGLLFYSQTQESK